MNGQLEKFEQLLERVDILNFKYSHILETKRHDFNIFAILHQEDDEVRLHSRFLYELLNPKGSHRQSDTFLALLMQQLEISREEFDLKGAYVLKEDSKIDILIANSTQALIIENKIHAPDQLRQLERYYQKLVKRGLKQISIIYLTLDGREPSKDCLGDLDNRFVKTVSYKVDLVTWLSKCIQVVALNPPVRETLLQYQTLIKKLTGQSMSEGYIMEIRDLLLQGNNFQLALDLEDAVTEVMIETQFRFWEELEAALVDKGYRIVADQKYSRQKVEKFYLNDRKRGDYGIMIDLVELGQQERLYFFIEVHRDLHYGFTLSRSGNRMIAKQRQYDALTNIIGKLDPELERNDWWLGDKYPQKEIDFDDFREADDHFAASLVKAETRAVYINELLSEVDPLIKRFLEEFAKVSHDSEHAR